MAQAEQPERLRDDRPVTVDDVRQLMRIRRLIEGLPPDDPARIMGEREIRRLELIAYAGEVRGEGYQEGMRPLPSVDLVAAPPNEPEGH